MSEYVDWPSSNGTYRYWFLSTPAKAESIKSDGGNYMFVKPTNAGWVPVYIGIADNLSARISSHDRWNDAVAAGATRVMAHTQSESAKRGAEEAALIAYWQPPLNTQLRKPKTGYGG